MFSACASNTAPIQRLCHMCFPHIRISNIWSLVVITYTFGKQRQSTDWEGEREAGARKAAGFFLKHVWMINYLALQKGSTGFKEHRHKLPPNECFPSTFRIIEIWFKGKSESFFCPLSRLSTERGRSFPLLLQCGPASVPACKGSFAKGQKGKSLPGLFLPGTSNKRRLHRAWLSQSSASAPCWLQLINMAVRLSRSLGLSW